MINYLIFGGLRNALGVFNLWLLVQLGVNLSLSLFFAMSIGFILFFIQVKKTVGKVKYKYIIFIFIINYLANRIFLFITYEYYETNLIMSQIIYATFVATISYLLLKSKLEPSD